jgi:hypothetical protein
VSGPCCHGLVAWTRRRWTRRSWRWRTSGVIIDYVQPWLRPCEAHSLSANLDQVRALPERLQELLGFNQATPYLGFIEGKHPRAWLGN